MADYDHLLTIEGVDENQPIEAEFEATGYITGRKTEDSDTVNQKYAKVELSGPWSDKIAFNGYPKDFRFVEGFDHARLFLDGVRVWPAHLTMGTVILENKNMPACYELSASKRLIRSTAGPATIDDSDTIAPDGKTARGRLAGGADAYRYAGTLGGLDANANLRVVENGVERTAEGYPPVGGL